jgi:hypothetical protein
MIHTGTTLFVFVFFLNLGFTSPAFAYLDPGTGSMILQLLLGGVAGALVIAKLYWHRLKSMFGAKVEPSPTETKDK